MVDIDRAREFQESEHDRRTTMTTAHEEQEKDFETEATEEVMNSKDRGIWFQDVIENMNISDSTWCDLFDSYLGDDPETFLVNDLAAREIELGYRLHKIIYPVLVAKLKEQIHFAIAHKRAAHEDMIHGWRGE